MVTFTQSYWEMQSVYVGLAVVRFVGQGCYNVTYKDSCMENYSAQASMKYIPALGLYELKCLCSIVLKCLSSC